MSRSGVFASTFVASLAFTGAAGARELAYSAPAECPTQSEVASRIDASAPPGRSASIAIRQEKDGYRGVVTVGETTRTMQARTCDAVVDALSLVVALDVTPAPAAPTEPEAVGTAPPARDAVQPPHREDRRSLDLYPGILATGTGYPSRGALIGASAFFEIGLPGPTWYQPSGRFLLSRTLSQRESTTAQSFSFRLTTVALEPCPLGVGTESGALRISACGRAEVGAVEVDPFSNNGTTRTWAAMGGIVRARVAFATIDRTKLTLDGGGGIVAPLVRDRFLSGGEVVGESDPTIWMASLGFGVMLP
ncbi:MAG TPA: hypothetical protein VIF62_14705 [Labilithrix sp.]